MFDVIGRHTVVQLVNTKSATQYVPLRSSKPNDSLSCVVNSKSSTFSDIVVSIFSPPQAASIIRINVKEIIFKTLMQLLPFYTNYMLSCHMSKKVAIS